MSMGVSGGGGLRTKRHAFQQNAEMNITPFVDVMLVLLIIFMVAAPIATVSVPVDLPPVNPRAAPPPPVKPIYISIQKDGALSIGENRSDLDSFIPIVQRETHGDLQQRIMLRCDEAALYGKLVAVMNRLQAAGYNKVGLIAQDSSGGIPAAKP
jgi:biopolymer transport protein ExbD/biopolymer transport protein TolR